MDEIEEKTIEIESANLYDLLEEGGILMIPLILLLLVALTIILERVISYTKHKRWNIKQFSQKLRKKVATLPPDIYRETLEEDLEKDAQGYIHRMEKGLDLLAGIGNLAPLVGFLGTVLGMIHAFASIATTANVNAKVVAGGIKEALVTTAGGLCVAVPTLVVYYIFIHIVNNSTAQINSLIRDLCQDKKTIVETESN